MSIEERLRAALRAKAEGEAPDSQAWDRVQAQVRRQRSARRARLAVLSTAALVAVALGVGSQLIDRDDEQPVVIVPADDESTTTTETTLVQAEAYPVLWPPAPLYEGDDRFLDPATTAELFARDYLHMPDPVVSGDDALNEVMTYTVQAKPGHPMHTMVTVRRDGGTGPYVVTAAETANIQVDRAVAGAGFVEVRGTSTAFEATVLVEIRAHDTSVIGTGFVMGGSMGEMAEFAGKIEYDGPLSPANAVFVTDSAEDGGVQEATVVQVTEADPQGTRVSVFFHRSEDELVEVVRAVPTTTGVLRAALEQLVAGPRPEDGDDVSSPFSDETADILAGVNLGEDGTAIVDLARTIENGSTSAMSRAIVEELNATVFQFPSVERVEYRLNGSCDAFWEWLQGECHLEERG